MNGAGGRGDGYIAALRPYVSDDKSWSGSVSLNVD
jgi:hypothetical protein